MNFISNLETPLLLIESVTNYTDIKDLINNDDERRKRDQVKLLGHHLIDP